VLTGCGVSRYLTLPYCSRTNNSVFVLLAQSVPTATRLPCVTALPAGWTYDGSQISNGQGRFWLDSDRAGIRAVEVLLQPSCDSAGAVAVRPAPDETGTVVFARPETLEPSFTGERLLQFPGGCITYSYRFAPGASSILAIEADEALGLVSRATIVAGVRADYDETLCGAGAPPCPG
jgi:hypothetical protein